MNQLNSLQILDNTILFIFQLEISVNVVTFINCLDCGEILESTFVHDFVKCSCRNPLFLDGGDDYCRYGGKEKDRIQIIDSTTIHSFVRDNYPTYDPLLI